jgi:hypothetical protein
LIGLFAGSITQEKLVVRFLAGFSEGTAANELGINSHRLGQSIDKASNEFREHGSTISIGLSACRARMHGMQCM